jgi:hypothetical protein
LEVILKKQILSILATLTLIIPMAIIGVAGLSGRVIVDIPFDFTVGNKELKAGKYAVSRLSTTSNSGALIIRAEDNSGAANFNVNGVTDKEEQQPRVVFNRYGNKYFLAQIFDGVSNEGFGLMKSKAEREAAKKGDTITQNVVKPHVVTVAAQIGR